MWKIVLNASDWRATTTTWPAARFAFIGKAQRVVDSILAHDGDRIRQEHLSQVDRIVERPLTPMLRHLYWSLYAGVITFWVADPSRKQEDTLAFIDQSVALFIDAIRRKESGT